MHREDCRLIGLTSDGKSRISYSKVHLRSGHSSLENFTSSPHDHYDVRQEFRVTFRAGARHHSCKITPSADNPRGPFWLANWHDVRIVPRRLPNLPLSMAHIACGRAIGEFKADRHSGIQEIPVSHPTRQGACQLDVLSPLFFAILPEASRYNESGRHRARSMSHRRVTKRLILGDDTAISSDFILRHINLQWDL